MSKRILTIILIAGFIIIFFRLLWTTKTARAKSLEAMAKSGVLADNEGFIRDFEILIDNINAWFEKFIGA